MPINILELLGRAVSILAFVDADNAGNVVTSRLHTGILIFVNNAPIIALSKRQNTVELSNFGSKLVATGITKDLIVALRIKFRMFLVPMDGPEDIYCDNQGSVKNTSLPKSTLSKKHNSINYHDVRENVAALIMRFVKEDTLTNLADALTKLFPYSCTQDLISQILWDN